MSTSAEGWFVDPQDASRLRWWDGVRWTHHTHPLPGREHTTRPLPRWWSTLSVVVQASLLVCAAASAFTLWVDQQVLAFVEDLRLRPDSVTLADAERIDTLTLWSLLEVLTMLVTGVLFVVWLYTAHHSSRMDRRALRHGSGWAIGGWFVPVLNLWRPFQVVSDVRRGATGDAGAPVPFRQGWWWGTWIALGVVSGGVSVLYSRATAAPDGVPYAEALGDAASWERLSSGLTIVCAVLAVSVVRELTALAGRPAGERRQV